jgi:hypothetical protein
MSTASSQIEKSVISPRSRVNTLAQVQIAGGRELPHCEKENLYILAKRKSISPSS